MATDDLSFTAASDINQMAIDDIFSFKMRNQFPFGNVDSSNTLHENDTTIV